MEATLIERLASVSPQIAMKEIAEAYPGSELLKFERKGRKYFAELKLAEFPPAPAEEKPMHEEPKDEPPVEDDPLNLGDDDDLGPDDDDKGKDEDGKEDRIIHMLEKLFKHFHISEHDEEVPGEEEGLDLPDIGAPEKGEMLPPPKKPLPPPVANPKMAPGAGGGSFSHVLQRQVGSRRTFVAKRSSAGELNNKQIVNEAVSGFPGYRVAKLTRNDDGTALVAMVAKHAEVR